MPARSKTSKQRNGTDKLGPVLHRLRLERSIPASKLSKETGLSRSYISYLEGGRFRDVGIEKFVRLLLAFKVSADQVLAEAGYLPSKKTPMPHPEEFLRAHYKLSPTNLATATDFLEFLSRKQKRGPKAEKEPTSRK